MMEETLMPSMMEENLSGGLKGYSSRTCTQEGKAIKRYLFWIYLLKMKKKKKKKTAKIEEKSLHISGTTWWASMKLTGKKLIMIKLIAEEKKLGLGILKSTILRKPRRLGNGI